MSILAPIGGLPGFGTVRTATERLIFRDSVVSGFLSQGKILDGTKSRDPGNTGNIDVLRAGLLLGKVTAAPGKYATSVLGVTGGTLTGTGTSITVAAALATEIIRRIGATGTLTLTGPPVASGVVRQMTATYSAVGATTVTITALGVNEVQTVNFNIASTGGSVVLRVPKTDGTFAVTTPISWSATDATYLSSINTALDVATGVTGGIVATAITAVDTDLGFVLTFSGTGYAGLPQPTESVSVETLPTSSTAYNVARTTAGVDGRFIAGSFIGDTDGSQIPLTFIPEGYGVKVSDLGGTSQDQQFGQFPISGVIITANLLPAYPSDSSLKTWLKTQLSTLTAGKYVFDDAF